VSPRYDPAAIEARWQQRWEAEGVFAARDDDPRPKKYVLVMFPYPSGSGLHLGHASVYTISDVAARYARMRGFAVLHPMGWDAFGLPAEQYAVENRIHPTAAVAANVENFKRALRLIGCSYDWTREVSTTDPAYYRWTQWIFLRLLERGLAYETEAPVNWCPALGTVLANEEVVDGKSERGGHPVVRVPMRQWMLRITAYADRLLDDLETVEWPENVKRMQREWIGRSEGAEVVFRLEGGAGDLRVFTTRPDTLFGATFCVVAPEHPLLEAMTAPDRRAAVRAYVEAAARKSERDRIAQDREKTGVFTGARAVNPATGQPVPVWVADYVLATYGTGAIMAVPGHDARDWEFARTFGLPVVEVITGGDPTRAAHEGEGTLVRSGVLDGLPVEEAKRRIVEHLEPRGLCRRAVRYKLRDWLFSRQRFWGEPIPILHREDGRTVAVADDRLPVTLPEVPRYEPTGTGDSPLAAIREWVATTDPRDGAPARRETNTMPGSAGSSWYFLRFVDPRNDAAFCDPAKERRWMPVDFYVGGPEHSVGHLLYARFWHKVLFDLGLVSTPEPFRRLYTQGTVVAKTYRDPQGRAHPFEALEERDGVLHVRGTDLPVAVTVERMSKSKRNGIGIDEAVASYSGDAVRLAVLFLGPPEADKEWTPSAMEGPWRFLLRAWRTVVGGDDGPPALSDAPVEGALRKALHRAIDGVTRDLDAISYNTAISKLMVLVNAMADARPLPREAAETFVRLLAPLAPHAAEEMWSLLGRPPFVSLEPWPVADPAALVDETRTMAVQVNGKVRGDVTVAADADDASVVAAARAVENVRRHLEGKTIVKEIVVGGRLVNFVAR
jgi:leucyl-tRNA synthetase